jgi:myosin heavy subunit
METKNENAYIQNQPPRKSKGLTIFLVVVILVLTAMAVVLYFNYTNLQKQYSKDTIEYNEIKESLAGELTGMINKYDSLKTDNDSMNIKLEEQQDKIKKLLSMEASNAEKIRLYQRELQTLRNVLKSYIVQIDSLNTRNKELISENIEVKTQLDKAQTENVELAQQKEALTSKVQAGAVVYAKNIVITPLNRRNKETSRVNRLEQLRFCFTLRENAIAESGPRIVFVRVTRPDGKVIAKSEHSIFKYQDNDMVYTERREIDYENKDVDACLFWDNDGSLVEGTYTLDIYMDGFLIGNATFALN